jgi:5'-nucleotidase
MPFPIEEKLVIAVASSALFDLRESNAVFEERGEAAYREYQRQREAVVLERGAAFPFIQRLLRLNGAGDEPVEVVLISRNDSDTGLRVMNSIEHHALPISRAAFTGGRSPFRYINSFNACLFLSADEKNVREAIMNGLPAGRVLASTYTDDPNDRELRIAFDFDGVVVDDEAERVYRLEGIDKFRESELKKALEPHNPGPLKRFLVEIGRIHQRELARTRIDAQHVPTIRTAILTSRNAPAHKRTVMTLRSWGISIDETFFLGGMDKSRVLREFRPHLFFDDQMVHAGSAADTIPSVHVPFGVTNELAEPRAVRSQPATHRVLEAPQISSVERSRHRPSPSSRLTATREG